MAISDEQYANSLATKKYSVIFIDFSAELLINKYIRVLPTNDFIPSDAVDSLEKDLTFQSEKEPMKLGKIIFSIGVYQYIVSIMFLTHNIVSIKRLVTHSKFKNSQKGPG